MKHLAAAGFLTMALCVLPGPAQAQGQAAFTAKTVNLRAGPAREYPVVAVLSPGVQIAVQGCLEDYRWCDVAAGPYRGWVYGGNINYFYQNAYVPVLTWGPVIGIGILGFALNDYWGRHYRNRPFYRERHRWEGRFAPPRHAGPPPFERRPPQPGAAPVTPRFHPQRPMPLQGRPPAVGVRPAPPNAPAPGFIPGPAPRQGAPVGRPAPSGQALPSVQSAPSGPAVAPGHTARPRPARPEGGAERPRRGPQQQAAPLQQRPGPP